MLQLRHRLIVSTLVIPLVLGCDSGTDPDISMTFSAQLTGAAEVPAVTTNGSGSATFELNRAEDELRYTLTGANLTSISQAHIHIGPVDGNGPVVAFLFGPNADLTLTTSQVIQTGTITATDVSARPMIGFDGTFAALIDALEAGEAYANVHTAAHGGGEVRGQIALDP
jgi:hypothetical protein